MSYEITAAVAAPEKPQPRVLPPELNSYVTSLWFALGFGYLLLLILWPEIGGFLPEGLGLFILVAVAAALVGLGAWASHGITLGSKTAMRVSRLVLLIGMFAGLGGVIAFMIWKMSGGPASPTTGIATPEPNFFGASPVLSASLLAFAVLAPLMFAMFGFFVGMRDEVAAFFDPPPEEETSFSSPAIVEPEEVEAMLTDETGALDQEILDAEIQAQEAALAEGEQDEKAAEPLSASDEAAYGDADAPLSMGDLALDDDVDENKNQ